MLISNIKDGVKLRRLDFKIEETGKSVSSFLKSKGFSRTALTKLKKGDFVFFNDVAVPLKYYMTNEGTLTVFLAEEASQNVAEEKIPLDILFEDEHILAVNKPCGMPTHPSHGHTSGTLANGVMFHLQGPTFRAANRLDKNTSGIVLIAKNGAIAGRLKDSAQKEYVAIVHGEISDSGKICAPIKRMGEYRMERIVSPDGDYAKTLYYPIKSGEKYSLIRLKLLTGRTHQIRVHMSYIGHPLLGDDLYGGKPALGFSHHALHCEKMTFIHPISGEKICLTASLPEAFKRGAEEI